LNHRKSLLLFYHAVFCISGIYKPENRFLNTIHCFFQQAILKPVAFYNEKLSCSDQGILPEVANAPKIRAPG
jgi:hypothetical protein